MAELTKSDTRQPGGKVKPTDKMVMMPGLFDGTRLETSKQHYERFNLYVVPPWTGDDPTGDTEYSMPPRRRPVASIEARCPLKFPKPKVVVVHGLHQLE